MERINAMEEFSKGIVVFEATMYMKKYEAVVGEALVCEKVPNDQWLAMVHTVLRTVMVELFTVEKNLLQEIFHEI